MLYLQIRQNAVLEYMMLPCTLFLWCSISSSTRTPGSTLIDLEVMCTEDWSGHSFHVKTLSRINMRNWSFIYLKVFLRDIYIYLSAFIFPCYLHFSLLLLDNTVPRVHYPIITPPNRWQSTLYLTFNVQNNGKVEDEDDAVDKLD